MICEVCLKPGKVRQPKQKYENPNSIMPSGNDIVYLGLVVRCDDHLEDDMQ